MHRKRSEQSIKVLFNHRMEDPRTMGILHQINFAQQVWEIPCLICIKHIMTTRNQDCTFNYSWAFTLCWIKFTTDIYIRRSISHFKYIFIFFFKRSINVERNTCIFIIGLIRWTLFVDAETKWKENIVKPIRIGRHKELYLISIRIWRENGFRLDAQPFKCISNEPVSDGKQLNSF